MKEDIKLAIWVREKVETDTELGKDDALVKVKTEDGLETEAGLAEKAAVFVKEEAAEEET